jgi:flagellar hook-basal body complex protein FliE
MRIEPISSAGAPAASLAPSPEPTRTGFADALREGIANLASLQSKADLAAQQVAVGDLAHLHSAVIAIQEASLALDLVVAVRNHVVEGIQELLRTQV